MKSYSNQTVPPAPSGIKAAVPTSKTPQPQAHAQVSDGPKATKKSVASATLLITDRISKTALTTAERLPGNRDAIASSLGFCRIRPLTRNSALATAFVAACRTLVLQERA